MKRLMDTLWPVIGLAAVGFAFYLLYKELRGISANDVVASLKAIPWPHYGLAALSTLLA